MIRVILLLLISASAQGQLIMRQSVPSVVVTPIVYDTIAVVPYGNGSPQYTANPNFNNIQTVSGMMTASNLKRLNGTTSSIGVSWSLANATNVRDNGSGYGAGTTSGFPDHALRYVIFDNPGNSQIQFTGCNDAKTYDIVFIASRSATSSVQTISYGMATSTFNVNNNVNTFAKLTGLKSALGLLGVGWAGGGTYKYMGAFYLIEY